MGSEMLKKFMFAFLMTLFFVIPFGDYASAATEAGNGKSLNRSYSLRLPFVENQGQIENGKVAYYAKSSWGTLFIKDDGEVVYSITRENEKSGWAIRESFVGASIEDVRAFDRVETKVNYFKGSKPENWRRYIPAYNTVSLGEIYEGIKLQLKAYNKSVEKLFLLRPDANPGVIRVKIDGAESLSVNRGGELEIETGLGVVKLTRPAAYQEEGVEKKYVEVAYVVKGDEYGFRLGDYDRAKELVIDPLLASTFLGGGGDDSGGVTLAPDGSVFVAGTTVSSDFPATTGAYDTIYNGGGTSGQDVFIAKLSGDLTTLLAATFLGGATGDDTGGQPVVDSAGNVYIVGTTNSSDFPVTTGAYDTTYNGSSDINGLDVFVAKLDSTLTNLLASTYLGGTVDSGSTGGNDWGRGIALGPGGEIYVMSQTASIDFPTTPGAYDTTYNDFNTDDVAISRFSSDLTTLQASTYIGGSVWEVPYTITIDSSGNVYVGGRTSSSNYPTTTTAYDRTYGGGVFAAYDGFLSKFDAGLTTLLASTYLGTVGADVASDIIWSVDVDSAGNIYAAGGTTSSAFPTTTGVYDTTHNGDADVFVVKFDTDLTALQASTFIGGSLFDRPTGVVLDGSGSLYVSGYTSSPSFPATPGAYSEAFNGGAYDAFIFKMTDDLTTLQASTYFGGSDTDVAGRVQVAPDGSIYFGAYTHSTDFPASSGAYDTTPNGGSDAYVAKLDANLSGPWRTETVDSAGMVGFFTSIALDASGKAHISYRDYSNQALKYVTKASGAWVSEIVDVAGMSYTSIALDTSGKAHISYVGLTTGDLRYATNASGAWVMETVGSVSGGTSFALDTSGKAHISYRDKTTYYLKYATNASGAWVVEIVDSAGNMGQHTSLALDTSGKAHISYWDRTNYDLKYAVCCPDGWITQTVDSTGSVGNYTSIATDTSGKAHISYYDSTNFDLKYATNASGAWVTETVDSVGDVGTYTSIALDASGKAHISYYDGTNGDLKYATKASGAWVTEIVDNVGSVGKYTSLALDASDNVYISYLDSTNDDLKYATNAPVPTCAFIEGDADGSGAANVVDVIKARRFSLGLDSLPQDLCAVDIDSNTTVDILDVVNILRIALGLPTT